MLGSTALAEFPLCGGSGIGAEITNLAEATIQTLYSPRPLITLTIGAVTKRYSTETLVVPTGEASYGEAQYGETEYGEP